MYGKAIFLLVKKKPGFISIVPSTNPIIQSSTDVFGLRTLVHRRLAITFHNLVLHLDLHPRNADAKPKWVNTYYTHIRVYITIYNYILLHINIIIITIITIIIITHTYSIHNMCGNVFHTHLFMFICEFMYIYIYDIMSTFMFISCVCVSKIWNLHSTAEISFWSTEFPLGFASPADATDGTLQYPAFWKGKLMIFCTIASAPNPTGWCPPVMFVGL